MSNTEQTAPMSDDLFARVAVLELALATARAALAASRALVEQLTEERYHLRASHDRLRQELELLRRRIFMAKAERVDSTQLELEFAQKLSALDALSGRLAEQPVSTDAGTGTDGASSTTPKKEPSGRRDLRNANIPEVRVEIADPVFNKLVRDGNAERMGFEESYKLAWRGLWEASIVLKSEVAREGLFRIKRIYDPERIWRGQPPDEIKRLRNIHSRPLVEAFFAWATAKYEKVRLVRGPLRSAFGYLVCHKDALVRFPDDRRLRLDNNHSEGELRKIATGRKAWLFVGSDDHR